MLPNQQSPFFLQKGHIYGLPTIHYNMETAAQVKLAFDMLKPDCVAVELAENMELQLLHAASRLPDISLVASYAQEKSPIYYLCEPCDAAFEGLRSAIENNVRAHCIDLDVDDYPDFNDLLPDAYAIQKIGLESYYDVYQKSHIGVALRKHPLDEKREQYMAKRLKELSFSYDRILFISGMSHLENVFRLIDNNTFPEMEHAQRDSTELFTLSERAMRDGLAEYGWISTNYEKLRNAHIEARHASDHYSGTFPPDRQQLIFNLYRQAADNYSQTTGNSFGSYHLRNLMKFVRNYAFINDQLMPNLFQILTSARGCVDGNFAYTTWELATEYSYRKNIDNLPELDLSVEELWGHSKKIKFQLKESSRKDLSFKKRPDKSKFKFQPPGTFGICSYPPEDISIENFGEFLKKKGVQILSEEAARTTPFATSLEDGIDIRESIRHWFEKKLYVKVKGKPPGGVSSVVIIFDEDVGNEKTSNQNELVEKYPWKLSWLGEHSQESDMAFYATPLSANIVGPGISRCEYGGFMLSSPPRRMLNIWSDLDYEGCRTKAELLLVAAIDYAVKPLVVYVAAKPPRSLIKSFAARYGKKIVFIPISQLSPVMLNKIRVFHVLDGYDKRHNADEYIH
ncbi:MAG: hypothetical protein H0T62_06345 [Parachlamydiaceae bacterium]|nr:hypothetical protein [Parachlamydiaceae bacterium]